MAEAVNLQAPAAERTEARSEERTSRIRGTLASLRADQVLAIVAALMMPGGVLAIFLAWYGAAHTPFLFEQMPYLISGGLLGIGLLTAGGLLYVGVWVVRLAAEQRERAERVETLLAGVREDLQRIAAVGAGIDDTQVIPAVRGGLVVTPTGTMYHRPDCSVVAGRDDVDAITVDALDGYAPCKICSPPT